MTPERAVQLLGLPADFTLEQLLRAYHRRLFTVHPDTALQALPDAARLVEMLLQARRILETRLAGRESAAAPSGASEQSGRTPPAARQPNQSDAERTTAKAKASDGSPPNTGIDKSGGRDGYQWYRQAAALVGDTLEEYFKERLRFSATPESSPGTTKLQANLREARGLFARVLETHPGGMWTPDAVEQIARINVWLGRKHGTFTTPTDQEVV